MSEERGRGAIILSWWQTALADRGQGRARALAARLRRAGGVEALAEPEVHDLARRLGLGRGARDAARLVRLVQVLAWVREHTGARLAARLGGHDPALSHLRFQRLMRAGPDEIAPALRRALPMVERSCNVAALGADLLDWDHPEWGEVARTRWCFEYFGAPAPQTPAPDGAETPEENMA